MTYLLSLLKNKKVLVISKNNCNECSKLYTFLQNKKINFDIFNVSDYTNHEEFEEIMNDIDYLKSVHYIMEYPMLFIENIYIGNFKYVSNMDTFGAFNDLLDKYNVSYIAINDNDF